VAGCLCRGASVYLSIYLIHLSVYRLVDDNNRNTATRNDVDEETTSCLSLSYLLSYLLTLLLAERTNEVDERTKLTNERS